MGQRLENTVTLKLSGVKGAVRMSRKALALGGRPGPVRGGSPQKRKPRAGREQPSKKWWLRTF